MLQSLSHNSTFIHLAGKLLISGRTIYQADSLRSAPWTTPTCLFMRAKTMKIMQADCYHRNSQEPKLPIGLKNMTIKNKSHVFEKKSRQDFFFKKVIPKEV